MSENVLIVTIAFFAATYASLLTYWLLRRDLRRHAIGERATLLRQDAMTQLPNSEMIPVIFETKRVKAMQSGKQPDPISLILVDVDDLKQINTQFGLEGGDRLLSELVGLLKANTRGADDVLFRYRRGDEFLILCYGVTGAVAAERIATRILDLIREHDFYLFASADPVRITASIGVTEHRHEEAFDHMDERVEFALRQAKQVKNTIVYL